MSATNRQRWLWIAKALRSLLLFALALALVLRPTGTAGARQVLERYSLAYTAFLSVFLAAVVVRTVMSFRAASSARSGRILLLDIILWLQCSTALTYFHASLAPHWAYAFLAALALLSVEMPYWLFTLVRRHEGSAPPWRMRGVAAATFLAVIFATLAAAEIPARFLQNHQPDYGGLLDARPYRLNALGLRGEVPPLPKPASEYRILALGDSVTFGQGVALADAFPAQLEALLRQRGLQVRVINGGLRGTNTADQAQMLKTWMRFQPDLILHTFVLNDTDTSVRRPVLSLQRNPLIGWSTLLQAALMGLSQRMYLQTETNQAPDAAPSQPFAGPGWAQTKTALQSTAALARKNETSLILGVFPQLMSWRAYPHQAKHRQVLAAARAAGYRETIDLLPAFRNAGPDGTRFRVARYDGHPSAAGHRIVAKAYLRCLDRLSILPPATPANPSGKH